MRTIYTLLAFSLLSTAPCDAMAKMETFFDSKPGWAAPACLIGGCVALDFIFNVVNSRSKNQPEDNGMLFDLVGCITMPFVFSPSISYATTGLAFIYAAQSRPEVLRIFVETPLKRNPIATVSLFGLSLVLRYLPAVYLS